MLDLSKLKNRMVLLKLKEYDGPNEYIHRLRMNVLRGKVILTQNQVTYINDNYTTEPIEVNRIIEITPFFGEQLEEKWELKHTPKRILVETLLAESDKSYHVKGKLYRNQKKSELYFLPKTQINTDLFEDEKVDIDVDFVKYKNMDHYLLPDGTIGRTAYKYQEEGVKFLLSKKKCILADDMGLGKAAALDSKLLTPNGYINMGDVNVGDYVIGSNGKPTKVTGVYPKGEKKMFNITFTDGTIVETCDEHLWAVQTTNHKKRGNGFMVKPLHELMGDLTYGTKGNLKWYIPMVKPIEFIKQETHIDPYLMGCLLGDGGFSSHNIKLSSIDSELINECGKRLPKGYYFNQVGDTCDWHLCGSDVSDKVIKGKNSVIRNLKNYNLMGTKSDTKFVPKNYLYNTKKVRLEVLRGLLDTNGYCSKSGTIQHYSTSQQLSNDVKELVMSLGGVARQSDKMGSYQLPNGEIRMCEICYTLTINLPQEITPFKLTRKITLLNKNKKYTPSRGIKKIEFSRITKAQCISVEAKDRLYVMDNYVVTHNTYQSIVAALETDARKILVVCPANAKINWKREISNFVSEDDVSIP